MKHLKDYKKFNEDAYSGASIAGMGAVVSAQPSSQAGVTTDPGYASGGGSTGSGDIGYWWLTKSKNRKKGKPSEVSDMRFLAPAKGIKKVNDFAKDKN
jgi:hypothetical protein